MALSPWIYPVVICCTLLSGRIACADGSSQLKAAGMKYFVGTERGSFVGSGGSSRLRIIPEGNSLVLNLAERE